MAHDYDKAPLGQQQHRTQPLAADTPAATVLYQPDPALLDAMLSALDRDGRRLYIFANSPLDQAIQDRLAALANPVIIRSPTNVGLGAALNAILERATLDGFAHVLLLDQDSTPSPELPELLAQRFRERESAGAPLAQLGPLLVTPPHETYLPVRYAWRHAPPGAVDFLPTSGSLVSTKAWSQIGPFRADYFIAGIDVEWGFRAWSRGYASLVARDLEMVHRWGTPMPAGSARKPQILRHSDQRNYYFIRNSIDCLKQSHLPLGWKVRSGLRLAAQIAMLFYDRGGEARTRQVVGSALLAGLHNKLGPAPGTPAGQPEGRSI